MYFEIHNIEVNGFKLESYTDGIMDEMIMDVPLKDSRKRFRGQWWQNECDWQNAENSLKPGGAISGFTLSSLYFTKTDDFHNRTILKAYISLDSAIPFVEIYICVYKDLFTVTYHSLIFNNQVGNDKK